VGGKTRHPSLSDIATKITPALMGPFSHFGNGYVYEEGYKTFKPNGRLGPVEK